MIRYEFPSDQEIYDAAATYIVDKLVRRLNTDPQVTFVISGGSTPRQVLPLVAKADLDWHRVCLYASDERCLSPDHPDSTQGMAAEIFQAAGRPFNYLAPAAWSKAGAADWWAQIAALPLPAVAYLGIGSDGHTASIFPDTKEERIDADGAFWTPETPPHKHARISLTKGALMRANCVLLIANSFEKLRAFELNAARKGPVSAIMNSPGDRLMVCKKSS